MKTSKDIAMAISVLTHEFEQMSATAKAAKMVGGQENGISRQAEETTATCWLVIEALRWSRGDEDTAFGEYLSQLMQVHLRARQRKMMAR